MSRAAFAFESPLSLELLRERLARCSAPGVSLRERDGHFELEVSDAFEIGRTVVLNELLPRLGALNVRPIC